MSKKPVLYYPTEVRTYGLGDLAIPPKQYAQFLLETVNVLHKFVLQENRCQSLEEVTEKYARAMKKRNPEKSEEELKPYIESPLAIWVEAVLQYNRGISGVRKANQPYRSTEYEEDLVMLDGSSRINLKTAKKDLTGFVVHLSGELDTRFPQRKGKMPIPIFDENRRKIGQTLYDQVRGFRFGLNFRSVPTLFLQASVCLVDFGSTSSGKLKEGYYSVPAIEVEAQNLVVGSMALPQRLVEALGEVVVRHYKTGRVGHRTSYTKDIKTGC